MTARFVGSGVRVPTVSRQRRRLRVAAVLVLLAGVVALALWATRPVWLAGPRRGMVAGLG